MNLYFKYCFILFYCILHSICSIAQYQFQGIIIDSKTKTILPYATILNAKSLRGTLTNEKGYFKLLFVNEGDSIRFSYVGYKTQYVKFENNCQIDTIELVKNTNLLSEVLIVGDNSYLHTLILNCKNFKSSNTSIAKTYYELESFIDNTQIELVEAYYNGKYSDYNLTGMDIKNGRLGLKRFKNLYFVSTETSEAIYQHDLFKESSYFPINPFELTKKQLKKRYQLDLESKYTSEDGSIVYVITCKPNKYAENYFNTKVWINEDTQHIIRIELQNSDSKRQPFAPIFKGDSLLHVSQHIFKEFNQDKTLKSISYNYQLDYKDRNQKNYTIQTRAVLYAYDYSQGFILPIFQFEIPKHQDYRKINAFKYDTLFWENNITRLHSKTGKNQKFYYSDSTITNNSLFLRTDEFHSSLFEYPYIFWSKKRLILRSYNFNTAENLEVKGPILPYRYDIQTQLFLDVSKVNGDLKTQSHLILDPYLSYYSYPITEMTQIFFNIYFDLMEIKRRELDRLLEQSNLSNSGIEKTYKRFEIEMDNLASEYINDVSRGENFHALKKWNDYVVRKLDIDNISIFLPKNNKMK